MIIEELTLDDFAGYAGRHVLDLTPKNSAQPIVLIGGLNGAGKTSLMDAIQLCLYGKFAPCSNRGTLAYKEYLRRCINWNDNDRDTSLELEFRHVIDGKEERVRLVRSWVEKGSSIKEAFHVYRNGLEDQLLASNWTEAVERILPRRIAQLALFDGEKIETYANPEEASALIQTATHSLLGIDIVDQLDKDVSTLKQRKRRGPEYQSTLAEEEQFEHDYQRVQETLERARIAADDIRRNSLPAARSRLQDLEEQFEQRGGRLFEQRKSIEKELARLNEQISEKEKEIRDLVSGPLPLSMVRGLLGRLVRQAEKEREQEFNVEFYRFCSQRDQDVIRELQNRGFSESVLENIRQIVASDLHQRTEATNEAPYLRFSQGARDEAQRLRSEGIPASQDAAARLSSEIQKLREDATERQNELASVPAEENINDLIRQRAEALKDVEKLESELQNSENEISRLQQKRDSLKQQLLQTKEKRISKDLEKEDHVRLVRTLDQVQQTLDVFRDRAVRRHISKIEASISHAFGSLMRKDGFVRYITVDPVDFGMSLYDKKDNRMPPERLSAGERQLLSVSILWGLAQASKRQLPTVIDTPLGRLDSEHRANIVQKYFPNASHQVILLSTDQEIEDLAFDQIRPFIGRTYQLQYEEESGSIEVAHRYFGKELSDAD